MIPHNPDIFHGWRSPLQFQSVAESQPHFLHRAISANRVTQNRSPDRRSLLPPGLSIGSDVVPRLAAFLSLTSLSGALKVQHRPGLWNIFRHTQTGSVQLCVAIFIYCILSKCLRYTHEQSLYFTKAFTRPAYEIGNLNVSIWLQQTTEESNHQIQICTMRILAPLSI